MVTYFGRGGANTQRHVLADEGSALPARGTINFVGGGITATDDSGNDRTVVTVPSTITGTSTGILDPRLGVPQGNALRTYLFNSGVESWAPTAAGGTVAWDSVNNALIFVPSATNQSQALDPAGAVADGEVVADLNINHPTLGDCAVVFRYTDDNNYYMLALRTHQFTAGTTMQLYKRVAGTYTVISDTDAISAHEVQVGLNTRVRVMVRFVGPLISWYLNEAHVGSTVDSTYNTGRLGVRVTPGITSTLTVYQYQVFSLASTWEPYLYGSGGAGTAAVGMQIAQDEGIAVPQRSVLNFVGDGVSVTDDSVTGKTQVTIAGAGPAATGAILGVGTSKITVSSAQPSSPTTGDIWIKRS